MASRTRKTTTQPDPVLTRKRAKNLNIKVGNEVKSTSKPATKANNKTSLKRNTSILPLRTTDQRLKNLEEALATAVEKISSLNDDVDLMKQQIIDQSRDVNSILLDNSSLPRANALTNNDLQIKIDEILDKINTLHTSLAETKLDLEVLKKERDDKSLNLITKVDEITQTNYGDDNDDINLASSDDVVTPPEINVININNNTTQNNIPVNPRLNYSNTPTQPTTTKQKWKWFHISSIVTLTSDIVRTYISTRLNGCKVRCYSLTPRNSKTFKVGVPPELSRRLFDKNFWPIGTCVRDFHVRKDFQKRHLILQPL